MKLFYGGTFDPVHNGHLAIARAARDELAAVVHLMPAADPPHRAAPGAAAAQRAMMLELAVAGESGLEVDRRELRRAERCPGSRSYSVDTFRELRGQFGADVPLALLLGADSFLALPDWHEWRALFDLCHLVVAERPGSDLDDGLPAPLGEVAAGRWSADPVDLRRHPAGRLLRLRQVLQPESASEVRRRIASGQCWEASLPPPVVDYIRHEHLYGA